MFLSSSDGIVNVEDEALHSYNWQRSLIRLVIVLSALACGWCLSFGAQQAPAKKKVVHSTSSGAKKPAPGKAVAKAPLRASAKTGIKAPVKSAAGVPHVVAKTQVRHTAGAVQASAANQATVARASAGKRPVARSSAWKAPNYADSLEGDNVDGEDLLVRRAAVDALGPLNGSIVVTDANTGRVLTIVNQKLAFKSGYQPCSTVKVPVALAALSENVVDRETLFHLTKRKTIAMTEAIAHSNNQYFANLGEKLGFERVSYYARMFGLGEKAGLDIAGEQAGTLPAEVPKLGVGMMTSFGEGITLTPLEYAALIGAVANGGTLYYLQYPKTDQDAQSLIPRVKRRLDIDNLVSEIKPGMMGAVEYGTARRVGFDPNVPIYGKTGTCTDHWSPTHLGWFGSFVDAGKNKYVVVVLLTGGKLVSGPAASGVAGNVYKTLSASNFYNRQPQEISPAAMISAVGTGSN
jgi:penicillin-binding protein 2